VQAAIEAHTDAMSRLFAGLAARIGCLTDKVAV
jgi:hypothetical protein